ncbi:hypothetical protein BDZ91DRAFT_796445 [Kalaharituber pfeilii]|nr:hypothetical protein BDZ91DRAFT_796445 [Kalaharituber pfeilii]
MSSGFCVAYRWRLSITANAWSLSKITSTLFHELVFDDTTQTMTTRWIEGAIGVQSQMDQLRLLGVTHALPILQNADTCAFTRAHTNRASRLTDGVDLESLLQFPFQANYWPSEQFVSVVICHMNTEVVLYFSAGGRAATLGTSRPITERHHKSVMDIDRL